MRTIVFTLCDGAFNYDGRLTVVGTFDQIRMASIPGVVSTYFALKFCILEAELDQNAEIRIEFKDEHDNPISDSITKKVTIPATDTGFIHLAMAGSVRFSIAEDGKYRMIFFVDNQQVEEFDFSIVKQ